MTRLATLDTRPTSQLSFGMRRIFAFIAATAISFSTANSAEIHSYRGQFGAPFNSFSIEIVGPLERGDSEKFQNEIIRILREDQRNVIRSLSLLSPGGLVGEAISIGELVRALGLTVTAPSYWPEEPEGGPWFCLGAFEQDPFFKNDNCICASACALVWLSGISRTGSVAVHHHFLLGSQSDYKEFSEALATSRADIERFLRKMNVPISTIEAIFSTESNKSTVLDIEKFKNLLRDSVFSEFLIARCGMASDYPLYLQSFALRTKERPTARDVEMVERLEAEMGDFRECRSDTLLEIQRQAQQDFLLGR